LDEDPDDGLFEDRAKPSLSETESLFDALLLEEHRLRVCTPDAAGQSIDQASGGAPCGGTGTSCARGACAKRETKRDRRRARIADPPQTLFRNHGITPLVG
jgi:hypothetical protein